MANTKIQSEQIADSAITTDRIAADAITTAKIADSVALGGSPTTTTQSGSDNSTKIATTEYVTSAISSLIDSAPSTLNTLNEIAAALNDDANFNTTVTNSIAAKLPLAGGTMTGALNMGTQNITNAGTIASGAITTTASQFKYVSNTDSNVGLLIRDETYVSDEADITASRLSSGNSLTLGLAGQAGINYYVGGSNVASLNSSGNAIFGGTLSSGAITSSSNITSGGHFLAQAASAAAGVKIKRTNSSTTGGKGFIGWVDSDDKFVASIDARATGANNSGDLRFHTSTGQSFSGVYDNTSPALILGSNNNATFAGTISSGAITSSGVIQATGYLAVEGTSGNTGSASDRWIGGDGTAGTWFYNVPTGSQHLFGINNSNVLTLNGSGATVAGSINGLEIDSAGIVSKSRGAIGQIFGENIKWTGSAYQNINTSHGAGFLQLGSDGTVAFRKTASGGGNQAASYTLLINSNQQIMTGGLTSTTGQLHLYNGGSTSGILILQSQAAANAMSEIAFMSRDASNVNDNAYLKYNQSGNSTVNQFDFWPGNNRTFSISKHGSTHYGDESSNNGIGKFIGSVAPHGTGNRYIHIQISTTYNEMAHIFVHGYSYTSALIEGACAFYFYNNANQTTLYDFRSSGSIVGGYCNSSNNYAEIVIDTLTTATTNRWGSISVYGGQDKINAYHHTEIVQVAFSGANSRQFT